MRLPDWQSRFAAVIKDYQHGSFEWGRRDCCIFTCDAIYAMTGVDPATPFFRGRYTTKEEGYRLVYEFCEGTLETLVEKMAAVYSYTEVHPNFAQRGDIGIYRDKLEGPALGLCAGSQFVYLSPLSGLAYLPRKAAIRTWRVG